MKVTTATDELSSIKVIRIEIDANDQTMGTPEYDFLLTVQEAWRTYEQEKAWALR